MDQKRAGIPEVAETLDQDLDQNSGTKVKAKIPLGKLCGKLTVNTMAMYGVGKGDSKNKEGLL